MSLILPTSSRYSQSSSPPPNKGQCLISPHRVKVPTEFQAQKSHRGMACQNLGHHLPHWGMTAWTPKLSLQPLQKSELNPVYLIAYQAKVQTRSRGRFCIPCKTSNRIADKVFQPLQNSELNLAEAFAYPAFLCPESGEHFAALAKLQTESQAYFCHPCIGLFQIAGKGTTFRLRFSNFWRTIFTILDVYESVSK